MKKVANKGHKVLKEENLNRKSLRDYCFVYSTDVMNDIKYSFRSTNVISAVAFVHYKFNTENIKIGHVVCPNGMKSPIK